MADIATVGSLDGSPQLALISRGCAPVTLTPPIRGWCNRQHGRFWPCNWGFESSPPSCERPEGRSFRDRHVSDADDLSKPVCYLSVTEDFESVGRETTPGPAGQLEGATPDRHSGFHVSAGDREAFGS